jgi:SSS family solute:Na+ symporter
MDIYKPYFNKKASDRTTVSVGRIAVGGSLLIACLIAPLLESIPQAFQYIQEYTGMVSPGILAIFLLGLFWKKTNTRGAITGAIISIPVAALLKAKAVALPFLDQMFYTTLITMAIIVMVSLSTGKHEEDKKGISLTPGMFNTSAAFNISAYIICILLALLYTIFW